MPPALPRRPAPSLAFPVDSFPVEYPSIVATRCLRLELLMRLALAICCLLFAVSGCAFVPQGPPIMLPNPLPLPPAPPEYVWEEVVDVVDDYFEIDREAQAHQVGPASTVGRIDTFPAIGSTLFEPWKGDSTSLYARFESTLQSTRRKAIVQVIPQPDGSSQVEVQVYKELEDLMQPEMSPIAAATFQYTSSLQTYAEPVGGQQTPLGWIGQGRDEGLEQKMLAKISCRLCKGPPPGCKRPWWAIFSPRR
jgi:hypothetical protein